MKQFNKGSKLKKVKFPYGNSFIDTELPINTEVLMPEYIQPLNNPLLAIKNAILHPIGSPRLSEVSLGRDSVAIVINDITRPSPTETMLTLIIDELVKSGISLDQITVIIANGNHELCSDEDIKKMVGFWFSKILIINHDCCDEEQLSFVGITKKGLPVYVNKYYIQASLRILTGIITPHQSAGYSGGRKSVVPGIAGLKTLQIHHSFPIRPEFPVMGVINGNSFHEEAIQAAELAGVDFIVNVVKNYKGELIGAVAGDLVNAHLQGVAICEKAWVKKVRQRYDIVFVSPGGFPKDIDLHQAQKAVAVAEQVTKIGGTIVLIAKCCKGVGKFGQVLKNAKSIEEVIRDFSINGFSANHSSKAYMYARALKKFKLIIVTNNILPNELAQMFMSGFTSLDEVVFTLNNLEDLSILCMPYAIDCIPVVQN
ncbi:MAG: hypothetical protein VR72_01475 [Clostridiaceae bacterium BRH_c20a]|nr:MAG: hypothetical protein VR72_01475 [Clostridiaceae bacterium BRH_c20a]